MEQRPLRLGDIVDDYCPRERRVTNHVIVALVKDGIRQTRCSTCDTEHVFKAARLPRRKPKDDELPAGIEPVVADAALAAAPAASASAASPAPAPNAVPAPAHAAPAAPAPAPVVEERADDIWPAHRTLIRAQLPRVEGEVKEPRPIPEFTMHQRGGRGPGMYRSDAWSNGNGHGRGGGSGGFRQGPPGPPRDHNSGQPGGQPGAGGGGKRRRHRRRGRGPGPGPKVG